MKGLEVLLTIFVGVIILTSFSLTAYAENENEILKLHENGYQMLINGNFPEAIEIYDKIIKMSPNDEKALLNRAASYHQASNIENSLRDLDTILEIYPRNVFALEGKAIILGNFDCNSYDDCGPLKALLYLERILEIEPDNSEITLKRNELFRKTKLFQATDNEYIVNLQYINRDSEGRLVSVTESVYNGIIPSKMLYLFLDQIVEKQDTVLHMDGGKRTQEKIIYAEKNFVNIDGEKYERWYYEVEQNHDKRIFWTKSSIFIEFTEFAEDNLVRDIIVKLVDGNFPAIVVDVGDTSTEVYEILKRV